MTKSTITKTWIGGLATFAGGLLFAGVGVFLMLVYGGTWTQAAGNASSYTFNPILNGFFWFTIVVICIGAVVALAGGIIQFAAWIGALVNSYLLPDKTWFWILLIAGIVSVFLGLGVIGLGVMIAYVIAAPDGTPYRKPHAPAMPQPTTFAPTS